MRKTDDMRDDRPLLLIEGECFGEYQSVERILRCLRLTDLDLQAFQVSRSGDRTWTFSIRGRPPSGAADGRIENEIRGLVGVTALSTPCRR